MSTTEKSAKDVEQGQQELQEFVARQSQGMLGEDLDLDLALRNYAPDTKEEKQLVRKVDLWMIPMLWWMCVLCYVDRNNIVSIPFTFRSIKGRSKVPFRLTTGCNLGKCKRSRHEQGFGSQ